MKLPLSKNRDPNITQNERLCDLLPTGNSWWRHSGDNVKIDQTTVWLLAYLEIDFSTQMGKFRVR